MKHLKLTPFTWNEIKETEEGTQIIAGGGTVIATVHKRDLPKEELHNAILMMKSKRMYELIGELLREESRLNLKLPIALHGILNDMDNLFNDCSL